MCEKKARVSVARLSGYDDFEAVLCAVRGSLASLGGIGSYVKPGARVLLKVNLVAPSRPELAVTTHPAIVRAVIRLVHEAGGVCYVGDGPGVGDTGMAAKVSGITEVVESEGAELLEFRETSVYESPGNLIAKRLSLAAQLKDMDVIITLPKLKTHCQMAFTGALKNQFGLIPGAAKGQYHFRLQNRERFAELMVDINRTAHPALAVMDAVVGMEGPGPSGGTPRQIGLVLAGADLSAVDTVACAVIGLPVEEVPISMAARRCGYGVTELERIEVLGARLEELRIPDFKLVKAPLNILRILPLPRPLLHWVRCQIAPAPRIDVKKCVRCRRCERGCPVKPSAIEPLAEGGPKLYDSRCIRCYCCHEFCPVKAIELRKSLLGRLVDIGGIASAASRFAGRFAWLRGWHPFRRVTGKKH